MAFERYRRKVLPSIETRLDDLVKGDLSELYRYAVAGGKRIRPALTLLISQAFGGRPDMALDLACSIELTHCASLALDDILDWDEERRGKVALHRLQGLRRAVTTGFTMPSLAVNLAARYGAQFPRMLTDAWVSMCKGVYQERELPEATWEDYRTAVELKTGRLFATACLFGARAAQRHEKSFGEYGLRLGRAFQMADDLADGFAGEAEIAVKRLREGLHLEVRAAARLTSRWEAERPELMEALRDAPAAITSLKGMGEVEGT